MDHQSYSRILNYFVCEMTMPVKKHTYNFVANDQSSTGHLLTAAVMSMRHMKRKRKLKKKMGLVKKFSSPLKDEINCSRLRRRPNDNDGNLVKNTVSKPNDNDGNLVKYTVSKTNGNLCEKTAEGTKPCNKSSKGEISSMGLEPNMPQSSVETKDVLLSPLVTEDDREIIKSANRPMHLQTYNNSFDMVEVKDVNAGDKPRTNSISNELDLSNGESVDTEVGLNLFVDDSEPLDLDLTQFYSDPLLLCSGEDFRNMFRMTRSSFQSLLVFMSKEEMEPIDDVPLYKKLLIVLWLMGSSGSYSDAAQVFSVTEETAANCFFDICATLYNKSDSVIKWPTYEESNAISSRIEKKYGFPGVVGVLGCHYFSISIPKEPVSRREHFNGKKRTYSIALQLVCDDRLVIQDIFPGLPGGIPEAHVLRDSPLHEQLRSKAQPHQLVEPNKHILARSEYPQLTSMLTPYSTATKSLDQEESKFNELHENVCQLVDQTFQMLQDRFLTLKLLDPEVATMVLVAACVLHNICLENHDLF